MVNEDDSQCRSPRSPSKSLELASTAEAAVTSQIPERSPRSPISSVDFESSARLCYTSQTGCRLVAVPQSFDSVELLARWRGGDQEALQVLIPQVYKELRAAAHRCLRAERPGHTLQSTALVHEVYLRLAGRSPAQAQNRAHFVAVAARLMRQILVDYSRAHRAAKRGPEHKVVLTEFPDLPQKRGIDVIALDDALIALAQRDAQQVQIVELRFFGGLTLEETAEVIGISPATVKRDWNMAKAWLAREVQRGGIGRNKAVGEN